jgi:hypothetical protein
MLVAKASKRLRSLAAEAELASLEVAKRARKGRALEVPVLGEVDAVGAPRALDLALLVVGQLAAQVLDRVQVEMDGLEGARAGSRVRAVLTRRDLGAGQGCQRSTR